MLYRGPGQTDWQPAEVRWEDEGVVLVAGGRTLTTPLVRFDNGDKDYYPALAAAARAALNEGIELKACANCLRFRFSGQTRQFSSGRQGYCTLIGFRKKEALVTVDYLCERHEPVPGWPDDLEAAQQARLAAR